MVAALHCLLWCCGCELRRECGALRELMPYSMGVGIVFLSCVENAGPATLLYAAKIGNLALCF